MALLRLEIDPEKFRKFGLRKRDVQRASKAALEAMASKWWHDYLPLHFDETAYGRYRYSRRKGQAMTGEGPRYRRTYVARKRRLYKHNRPLVWSGEGMRLAIGLLRLRGSSKEARVILPSKFNYKHPKSRISMRDEITRIIPSEAQELLQVGRLALRAYLARPQPST